MIGRRLASLAIASCLGALLAGCSADEGVSPLSSSTGSHTSTAPQPSYSVRQSVNQIAVWKGPVGAAVELRDVNGNMVQSATTDSLGSYLFRKVPAGDGYSVSIPSMPAPNTWSSLHVMSVDDSLPDPSFYSSQKLEAGFNYITTRDGTKLAAFITLPGPADQGPYPTVVNYSGYNPAQPGAPMQGDTFLCPELPTLCDAPNDPSALIAALLGYATVGVNMRGTGCSGGAYDYFEPLQLLDGYDVIEAVAAQSWVFNNHVGMTGLSYPGISQLFVATTHPPHLAAITPLSVIGNTYTTGVPGGIFNDGFALEWISQVVDKAAPYGQGWEKPQVATGDEVCADNQLLHGQAANVIQEAQTNPYYTASLMEPLNPSAFVGQIDVPVFLSGAWQDEQTGPYFFNLLDKFTGSPLTRFTMFNGVHPDGFAPQNIVEWKSFLDIYVAHRVPNLSEDIQQIGPELFENFFQVTVPLPALPLASEPSWEAAKAAYEANEPYRVIFEDGALDPLGGPEGTFEMHFPSWPPPQTKPMRFYFQPDGSLQTTAPADDSQVGSTFQLDPPAGHRGILAPNGNVWDPIPDYSWRQPMPGFDVVMETPALTQDLVMVGSASVDLWVRSPVADDADLEINIMEIRPDGQEMYVSTGWLRASLRALAPTATDLWPEHTYTQADEALLVPGQWTAARIGVPAFGHVFRKGSKIRVTVDTPGDSRAAWEFALKTFPGTVTYDIAHSATYPSSVLFPVLDGVVSSTPLPACPSLRAQQCRTYMPYTNTPSAP
jgi:predicted acyl esterase